MSIGRAPIKPAAAPPSAAAECAEQTAAAALDAADVQTVFDALCVAGWHRGKTPMTALLRALGWRRTDGGAFTVPDTAAALRRLVADGRAQVPPNEGWMAAPQALHERLPQLLARPEARDWWRAWVWVANGAYGSVDPEPHHATLRDDDEARALMRLVLVSGIDAAGYNRLAGSVLRTAASANTVARTLDELHTIGLLGRVQTDLLWRLLVALDAQDRLGLHPALLAWADAGMDAAPGAVPATLKLRLAEHRLHRGDLDGMRRALRGDEACAPFAGVLEAAALARDGRFAEAAPAFAQALKLLGATLGRRRSLAPQRLLQWYALALLGQPDAAAWTAARKLCVAESGSRQPSEHDDWGRWAHAVAVRLGDARIVASAYEPSPVRPWMLANADPDRDADRQADRLLLAAWLEHPPQGWTPAQLDALVAALHRCGLPWKADLVAQACERMGLPAPARPAEAPPPWPVRFFASPQAAWRNALDAIVALGDGRTATAAAPLATLRWQLTLDAAGRAHNLQAFEPAASGRGRPKLLTLAQLKKRTRLDPRDAAVARCVRAPRYAPREVSLDLVQATQALINHPAVELADAPGVAVELRESLPVLHLQRQRGPDGADCFVFGLEDELLATKPPDLQHHAPEYNEFEAELERRNSLRVVRESPERARVVRISAAQRRVAELVAQRWSVPVEARAELDAALRVLSGHFVVHSDAEAGEPVPGDARLVAQLQPRGDALQLQLAVRPFGDFGPLLAPGSGRTRLMTLHGGVSLATARDHDAERGHLAAALEAMPFLGEAPPDATWLLDDPEDALATVHALGRMVGGPAPAAAATGDATAASWPLRAIEWPRGKPLRVLAPAAGAMKLAVKSTRDWFALEGELVLDEGRVLPLQRLLSLLRESRGKRFIALGEGEYLALADQLRQRLADLDAIAEAGTAEGTALKLGSTGAAWLADAAGDLGLRGDARWRERAARLEEAASLEPLLPLGLQAQLRPYQADGYAWMLRLAHAGFGACLADDMGLGKTVQTLALLLQRAAQGPALVVAPTSVCANWADEAARFAPALRVAVYGDGDRSAQVAAVAAGDLLVVSYALLLRDAEVFAQRDWTTLVLDEAQALKNAATQRVKAVSALQAGFRLALSGTPVENRLADLWSIMNLLNPGLLGSANRFGERFAGPIERGRDDAARARLRRLVSPFLLRRTKAQVLTDLPPRTEIVHRVEPGPEERAFLEAARRAALERMAALDPADGRQAFNVLAELTRLRRAACDPRLAAPELGLVGAKVQAFERLATELVAGGHQALVFSQFTDFLKLLAERLDAAGLRYQYLDGSTPAASRAQRVAAFQRGEGELFLISLKAGGYGLNLTAADYVVIADPWWNPAAEDQAMGRAHRIGQLRPVTVYRLVTAGSVEERIVALHQDKRDLAEGLLAGQDGGAPLQADDLMALLRES